MPDDSSTKDHPKNDPSKVVEKKTQTQPLSSQNTCLRPSLREIRERLSPLIHRPGVHTVNHLGAAGFTYNGDGDTARCAGCELQVSNWTKDMDPFTIHSQQSSHCPFIHSIRSSSSPTIAVDQRSVSNEQENPSTRQGIRTIDSESLSNTLIESDLLQQVRRRTFSHWSGHNTLPRTRMIEAGFFHCNVGDRVICIYCNLICQHWTPNVDDPCEVHRTLSPNCIYARAFLTLCGPRCIINSNGNSIRATGVRPSFASNNINSLSVSGSVRPTAENNNRNAIQNGSSSSSTGPYGKVRSVDNIIQANYFNTDTKTIDTCPSCNGSLQIWGSKDHPMIEHARWFPHCPYVQQLRGTEMFLRIQASNRAQREPARTNKGARDGGMLNTNLFTDDGQLWIPNERTLFRLVAARLDLPISQRLLNQGFQLSIIKRCWEDQLRSKREDFVSDVDLYVACVILQKQIEHINGKKENIIIPSVRMRQIREKAIKEHDEKHPQRQATAEPISHSATRSSFEKTSIGSDAQITTSNDSEPSNLCLLCLTEEIRLACLPCGHLATCVPCGHSLRSCPICRTEIDAFFRIHR